MTVTDDQLTTDDITTADPAAEPKTGATRTARDKASALVRKTQALYAVVSSWVADGKSTSMSRKGKPMWKTHPPTLHELYVWTKTGRWVQGDQHPILEGVGKAYGYLIVLPLTAAGYGLLYVVQRPGRLLLTMAGLAVVIASYRFL